MALTWKAGAHGIEITGYEGEVRHLIVPSEIDGSPVTAIGPHALAERSDIVWLSLPESVRKLRAYCLHGCANLRHISLFDSAEDYYDGVIKGCRGLREVEIRHAARTREAYRFLTMHSMLADNDRQLTFRVEMDPGAEDKQGEWLVLTFPDYYYGFQEDTMARAIHHKIEGAGYAYRECVARREVDLAAYDGLFRRAVDDNPRAAACVALGRLMYPVELAQDASRRYAAFLSSHAALVLELLIAPEEESGLLVKCQVKMYKKS